MSKSLLRTLEDETTVLSRTVLSLQQEVDTLRKQATRQGAECAAEAARAQASEEAAAHATHLLRLEQASTSKLEAASARLEVELRSAQRDVLALSSENARLQAQVAEAAEHNTVTRQEAEELRIAVRAREEAVGYESARGAALESGVDALATRLRAVESMNEARVADWLTERRRLQAHGVQTFLALL